jgi:hypothetical protein
MAGMNHGEWVIIHLWKGPLPYRHNSYRQHIIKVVGLFGHMVRINPLVVKVGDDRRPSSPVCPCIVDSLSLNTNFVAEVVALFTPESMIVHFFYRYRIHGI